MDRIANEKGYVWTEVFLIRLVIILIGYEEIFFGAIAGAGIILMVMCCSTGDRHEWSPK